MKLNKAKTKIISEIYSQLAAIVNQGYAKAANEVIIQTEYGTVVFNR